MSMKPTKEQTRNFLKKELHDLAKQRGDLPVPEQLVYSRQDADKVKVKNVRKTK